MLEGIIHTIGARYEIRDSSSAVLTRIKSSCGHFIVPSCVFSPSGSKYKIVGVSPDSDSSSPEIDTISFDSSSEVAYIPLSFVFSCRVRFILPHSIKRLRYDSFKIINKPKITIDGKSDFISVTKERNIMNNHPLEIVCNELKRTNICIRETTRVIGIKSFYKNPKIRKIVFPSSVEIIGEFSFIRCQNLNEIIFKGRSNLRKIGGAAFFRTSLESVDFPSTLEEIGNFSFNGCVKLKSITFPKESRLKYIGENAFESISIKSVEFPSSLVEIDKYAFKDCKSLRVVLFRNDTRSEIKMNAFEGCPLND